MSPSAYWSNYSLYSRIVALQLSRKCDIEADLLKTIKTYKQALTNHTKKDSPIKYAETQNDLGVAYGELFDISFRIDDLEKAINAFEEASTVFTKKDSPIEYAMAQNNLGVAYSVLAEITGRKAELKKAIQAFEEALTIDIPKDWPARHGRAQIEKRLKAARKDLEGQLHQSR